MLGKIVRLKNMSFDLQKHTVNNICVHFNNCKLKDYKRNKSSCTLSIVNGQYEHQCIGAIEYLLIEL